MTATRTTRPGRLTVGLALLACLATIARADVRDDAGVFGQPAVDHANAAARRMERNDGKEFVVETYRAVPDDLKAEYQRKGKEAFFRDWMIARARALNVNGVFVLVCMDPSHLEVEAGKNTVARGLFTHADVVQLREQLQAAFKAKTIDQGLTDAADFVERTYAAHRPGGQTTRPTTGPAAPSAR